MKWPDFENRPKSSKFQIFQATTTTTAELVAPVTTETNGTAPATEENGEAKPEEGKTEEKRGSRLKKRLTLKWGKNRDQTEAPKEPEAPADPRADVIAWITQQIPVAVHKVVQRSPQ